MLAALEALDGTLPLRVPVIIGEGRRAGEELRSTDPGRPDRVVALAAAASAEEVGEATARAGEAARSWGALSAGARADMLRGAAAHMRSRRHALAALAVRECAKPWREADADVCEAIDFLEYYAPGRGRAPVWRHAAGAGRRAQHAATAPAGRDRGRRAVELPVRDRHGDDRRRARGRKPGVPQARRAVPGLRSGDRRGAAERRRPGGSTEPPPRGWRARRTARADARVARSPSPDRARSAARS